jgi:hypothetical protein
MCAKPDPQLERPNPISGLTDDSVERIIYHAGILWEDIQGEAPEVTINGAVAQGPQAVKAVALLGIDTKALDREWRGFLANTIAANPVDGAPPNDWLLHQQEGSSWRVDVNIPESVDSVDDLAYMDARAGTRWVTFSCRRWDRAVGVYHTSDPIPPGAKSEMVYRQRRLEDDDLGAVGMSWFSVNDAEHKSTIAASTAITAAKKNLLDALDEIEIASRVAKAAWKGPRSEAARFKFAMEYDVIATIKSVTEEWERYMQGTDGQSGLVSAQQELRKADQQLLTDVQNEVSNEIKIALTTTMLSAAAGAGAGAPVGGIGAAPGAAIGAGVGASYGAFRVTYKVVGLFGKLANKAKNSAAKVRGYAQSLQRNRDWQLNEFKKAYGTAGRLRKVGIVAKTAALHTIAEGSKNLAATAHVNATTGNGKKTLDDWWKSFVFAGLISGAGGKMFDDVAKAHKINMDTAKYGATKDGATGVAAAGAKGAGLTNDPLIGGVVTAPLAGAAKRSAITKITQQLVKSGMDEDAAKQVAEEALVNPAIAGAKAGAAKGIDEYRKEQGETPDLPTPGEGLISKRPVAR